MRLEDLKGLYFAVLNKLEVFFPKSENGFAVAIRDDHVYHDKVAGGMERGVRVRGRGDRILCRRWTANQPKCTANGTDPQGSTEEQHT